MFLNLFTRAFGCLVGHGFKEWICYEFGYGYTGRLNLRFGLPLRCSDSRNFAHNGGPVCLSAYAETSLVRHNFVELYKLSNH